MNANGSARVTVGPGGAGVVAQVGLHALGSSAARLGLGDSLSGRIPWTGERMPVHHRGEVLLNPASDQHPRSERCSGTRGPRDGRRRGSASGPRPTRSPRGPSLHPSRLTAPPWWRGAHSPTTPPSGRPPPERPRCSLPSSPGRTSCSRRPRHRECLRGPRLVHLARLTSSSSEGRVWTDLRGAALGGTGPVAHNPSERSPVNTRWNRLRRGRRARMAQL